MTEQPSGQLGVEQPGGAEADLGQAGEVLGGGVQHPFVGGERRRQASEVGEGRRVDEQRARTLASELDQVRALAVAVAARALGVDGDGPGAGPEGSGSLTQVFRRGDDRGQTVAGLQQRSDGALGHAAKVRGPPSGR